MINCYNVITKFQTQHMGRQNNKTAVFIHLYVAELSRQKGIGTVAPKYTFSSLHHLFSSLHHLFSSPHHLFSSPHHLFSSLHHLFSSPHHLFSSPHHLFEKKGVRRRENFVLWGHCRQVPFWQPTKHVKCYNKFQVVGHQYVSKHSSMKKQTTLDGLPINSVSLIFFSWSIPIHLSLFCLLSA